eukprot:1583269-Pyramimonas_sp.AAC.1
MSWRGAARSSAYGRRQGLPTIDCSLGLAEEKEKEKVKEEDEEDDEERVEVIARCGPKCHASSGPPGTFFDAPRALLAVCWRPYGNLGATWARRKAEASLVFFVVVAGVAGGVAPPPLIDSTATPSTQDSSPATCFTDFCPPRKGGAVDLIIGAFTELGHVSR